MDLVEKLSERLKERGLMMAAAESCTGGMIAAAMTDRAGSSRVFERGFVTYSNESKEELLGVPVATIEKYGAVSAETVAAMTKGALERSHAGVAVSVTGIAGPGGGTEEKPVGLVYIGWGNKKIIHSSECHFAGTRSEIRRQTTEAALKHLLDFLT